MTSLLLNPDPAAGGGGAVPQPADVPQVHVAESAQQTGLTVPASAVFGEDHKGFFTSLLERTKGLLPKQTTIQQPEPAKQPEPAPAAPEPPKAATPPPAPAAPEPPKSDKVFLAGKEWDRAELEKILAGKNQPPTPPPTNEPKVQQSQTPVPPTPEQLAAQKRHEDAARRAFIDGEREKLASYIAPVAKERLDKILTGEEGAAQELQSVLTETAAAAALRARESIYDELNPIFKAFEERLAPVLQQQENVQRYQAEQEFLKANTDLAEHIDDARRIADTLIKTYPREVSGMTKEEFFAEVKAHTEHYLNQQAAQMSRGKIADWKKWDEVLKNAAGVTTPTAAPEPPKPAPAAAPVQQTPTPAATKKPSVKPPTGNVPGVYLNGDSPAPDWHKSVAMSMRS